MYVYLINISHILLKTFKRSIKIISHPSFSFEHTTANRTPAAITKAIPNKLFFMSILSYSVTASLFERDAPEKNSVIRWKTAYSAGVKMMPTMVAISMPEKVVRPMARRLPAPAPVAKTSGNTPKMNDQAVINTAR